MIGDRLDPANLTPAASLNRVRFTPLSGLPIPAGMVDWAAYALLSAKALSDLTTRHGGQEAARRFGERLGWLLVTLRLGDPASRAVREDWDDSYWRHWASITTVFLGGGVVSGDIGPDIAQHASQLLASCGMADCAVSVAPWPEHLPLVGAARTVHDSSSAVVLDFGGSFVKRAIAHYEDGHLAALRIVPRLPARLPELPGGAEPTSEQTQVLGAQIVATMADTWLGARSVYPELSTTIVSSIASYLRDGQPLARQGGTYASLLALSENLSAWLSERISSRLGHEISVRLLHDGTAAAHAVAGAERTAVITLGTALGVGFAPAANDRPLSPSFAVVEARSQGWRRPDPG
ncbi:MAG: hypothetical protein U0893_28405 [Chloroflexota bacterium]